MRHEIVRDDEYPPERLATMSSGALNELNRACGRVTTEIHVQLVERRPAASGPPAVAAEYRAWRGKTLRVLADVQRLQQRVKSALKARQRAGERVTDMRTPREILADLLDELDRYDIAADDRLRALLDEAAAATANIRTGRREVI